MLFFWPIRIFILCNYAFDASITTVRTLDPTARKIMLVLHFFPCRVWIETAESEVENVSIRVGITDGNREFFERFHTAMREQYPDEIEVYLFPTLSKALKAVDRFRVRVVLIEPEGLSPSDLPTGGLPKKAYFARLADRKQDEKDWQNAPSQTEKGPFGDIPVLCRFRSVAEWHDIIVREASALPEAADKAHDSGTPGGAGSGKKSDCRVVLFTSAAGGTGTSTAARGFAECCQRHKRRVLYLDLQTFPDRQAERTEELFTMEDVLLSIRGRRYAPDAVLERALQSDDEGLITILPPQNPAALFDMTGEEIAVILDLVKESHRCTVIVLDLGFDATERIVLPYLTADYVVLVSNGTHIANRKTKQLMELLPAMCTEDPIALYEKTCLLYNRFRRGQSRVLQTEALIKLGGIGELDVPDPRDLEAELAVAPAMERLYERLTRQGG